MKQALNPYLPEFEYIPDGEPHVFGDRVYIYGSHDRFGGEDFCLNDYVCYSADVHDLADWRYEGVIYPRNADPDNADGKLMLWAPDVVQGKDGRYYLYYCLSREPRLRVAVCDTPAGVYTYLGKVRYPDGTELGTREGDFQEFDPGVFVDDDGTVYVFSGITAMRLFKKDLPLRNPVKESHVITLEADMLTVQTGQKKVLPSAYDAMGTDFEGHAFFEASSVRKIGGLYYYVYSSVESLELCYAISEKPDEGYRFGGTIIALGDVGLHGRTKEQALNFYGNTHGGLVQILDKWYIFYHRQTNRHQYSRQGCAEEIKILPDGSIPQVEMTSCGLNGGALRGKGTYSASIACNLMGKNGATVSREKEQTQEYPYFTQDAPDTPADAAEPHPKAYIANMSQGSVAGYKYFDIRDAQQIRIQVRSHTGEACDGKIEVSDTMGGDAICTIPVCMNKNDWLEFAGSIQLNNGIYPLYFSYQGEGSLDFLNFTLE